MSEAQRKFIERDYTAEEMEAGYAIAERTASKSYADYLREADAEHLEKGIRPVPYPLCVIGNDGE